MRLSALLFALGLLLSSISSLTAQDTHDHPALDFKKPPPVTLTFRGRYDREQQRVFGQLEMAWVQGASQSNDTVYVRRPGPDYQLDSIMFRGAPFDFRGKSPDSSILAFPLPRFLRPGERGFILMAYSVAADKPTRREPFTLLTDWLPQVMKSVGGEKRPCEWESLPARIYCELAIDSSLRVYTGGAMLNEKEMLGLQPTGNGVYEDITAELKAADLSLYDPEFGNGVRRYLFQVERGRSCEFMLGLKARVDRIVRGSFTVDIAYPPHWTDNDASMATSQLARMVDALYARLDEPSANRLMIAHRSGTFPHASASMVTIDFEDRKQERLAADAVFGLARWWQAEERPPESRRQETYVAQHVLFDLYGEQSVRALRAMYEPDVWPKYRRSTKPDCIDLAWIDDWELLFVEGPMRFHTINQLVGDSAFWATVVQHPRAEDSDTSGAIAANARWLESIENLWRADTFYTDYEILSAEPHQSDTGDGWFVEVSLRNDSPLQLPIDLAVVSVFGDTVMTKVEPGEGMTISVRSPLLNDQPFWVFLDPLHKLPELVRDNNQWRLTVPRRPNLTLPSGKTVVGDVLFERP